MDMDVSGNILKAIELDNFLSKNKEANSEVF